MNVFIFSRFKRLWRFLIFSQRFYIYGENRAKNVAV